MRILGLKRFLIQVVLLEEVKKGFILAELQDFDLVWVVELSQDLFQVVLLIREIPVVQVSTLVAHKNTEVDYQVGGFVLCAVDAVFVELVFRH